MSANFLDAAKCMAHVGIARKGLADRYPGFTEPPGIIEAVGLLAVGRVPAWAR